MPANDWIRCSCTNVISAEHMREASIQVELPILVHRTMGTETCAVVSQQSQVFNRACFHPLHDQAARGSCILDEPCIAGLLLYGLGSSAALPFAQRHNDFAILSQPASCAAQKTSHEFPVFVNLPPVGVLWELKDDDVEGLCFRRSLHCLLSSASFMRQGTCQVHRVHPMGDACSLSLQLLDDAWLLRAKTGREGLFRLVGGGQYLCTRLQRSNGCGKGEVAIPNYENACSISETEEILE
mmetsp:Transcript_58420/g.139339  ORF Transcript_58420/g.139339 Transcript_58420/m.139339 type:complete len:240 (+) Transcript_58420:136-855(+)